MRSPGETVRPERGEMLSHFGNPSPHPNPNPNRNLNPSPSPSPSPNPHQADQKKRVEQGLREEWARQGKAAATRSLVITPPPRAA